jgi:hypothetical protein
MGSAALGAGLALGGLKDVDELRERANARKCALELEAEVLEGKDNAGRARPRL